MEFIVIIFECIGIYFCLHFSFNNRINIGKLDVAFGAVYTSFFAISNMLRMPFIFDVILTIWMYVWSIYKFRKNFLNSIIRYVTGITVAGLCQVIAMWIMEPIADAYYSNIMYVLVIASFISSILSYFIYKLITMDGYKEYYIFKSKYGILSIGLIIVCLVCIKIDFETTKNLHILLYGLCLYLIILLGNGVYREQKIKYELHTKQLELDMNQKYGQAYDELLSELRRKQHDYKNQISALYSMHITAGSMEELVSMQRQYSEELGSMDDFDYILNSKGNPILIGYVYNKCAQASREGVKIKSRLNMSADYKGVPITKVIEMLGILLDNAREYCLNNDMKDKFLKLVVEDMCGKLNIEVCNPSEYMSYSSLEKIFDEGYSTKGKGRGMGLYSLKRIVEQYSGKLLAENYKENNDNWIRFRVEI